VRGDVLDNGGRVGALGIQVGVGIVFGGAPEVVFRVPEHRPLLVLTQDVGEQRGVFGCELVSHAWAAPEPGGLGCCARSAQRRWR
jgi:hypothetical protein